MDEEHHAMMNGPRVAQSMPEDYIKALLARLKEEISHGHKNCTKDNCESSGVDCPAADA